MHAFISICTQLVLVTATGVMSVEKVLVVKFRALHMEYMPQLMKFKVLDTGFRMQDSWAHAAVVMVDSCVLKL